MDRMGIKAKKKQGKVELDRQKQAEKKKRRLEKALAASAAMISELEKKKQKKKEQERLEEEGAAIAEAVALHVLLEDETSNDPSMFDFNKPGIFKFSGIERSRSCSREHINFGWHDFRKDRLPFSTGWGISEGLIAAEVVSSLQISDDKCKDLIDSS